MDRRSQYVFHRSCPRDVCGGITGVRDGRDDSHEIFQRGRCVLAGGGASIFRPAVSLAGMNFQELTEGSIPDEAFFRQFAVYFRNNVLD